MQHASEAVGIVGAGAVARVLGGALRAAGVPVEALASRTPGSARRAAVAIDAAVRTVPIADLPHAASRVILAVADAGIGPVAEELAAAGLRGVALHTSGASGLAPCAPLRAAGVACGVLHPLQTVAAATGSAGALRGATFAVAGDGAAVAWAESLVDRLGGSVLRVEAEAMPAYHAGAVLASNALVACIDAAAALMAHAGVPRRAALEAVGPLCRASVANALRLGPAAALTGPVVRGDSDTVATHLAALLRAPAPTADLYRAASRQLLGLARERKTPPAALESLARLLDSGGGGGAR